MESTHYNKEIHLLYTKWGQEHLALINLNKLPLNSSLVFKISNIFSVSLNKYNA